MPSASVFDPLVALTLHDCGIHCGGRSKGCSRTSVTPAALSRSISQRAFSASASVPMIRPQNCGCPLIAIAARYRGLRIDVGLEAGPVDRQVRGVAAVPLPVWNRRQRDYECRRDYGRLRPFVHRAPPCAANATTGDVTSGPITRTGRQLRPNGPQHPVLQGLNRPRIAEHRRRSGGHSRQNIASPVVVLRQADRDRDKLRGA